MSSSFYKFFISFAELLKNPVVKYEGEINISKEVYYMSFGKNLANFRKEKGLTQEELVNRSGVAISQIRRYEADKSSPTLGVIKRLAQALGTSIDELVFDKGGGIAAGKILDRELLDKFEMISNMEEGEKEVVKQILRAFGYKCLKYKTIYI